MLKITVLASIPKKPREIPKHQKSEHNTNQYIKIYFIIIFRERKREREKERFRERKSREIRISRERKCRERKRDSRERKRVDRGERSGWRENQG